MTNPGGSGINQQCPCGDGGGRPIHSHDEAAGEAPVGAGPRREGTERMTTQTAETPEILSAIDAAATDPGELRAIQDQLILDHMDLVGHLVNKVSSRYPRHVDRGELFNAGACGLVEAARRYRPESEVPFARYASIRIRGAIIDSARSPDWPARSVRRAIRSLRQEEEVFEAKAGRQATDEELAKQMGIGVEALRGHRENVVTTSLLHLDYAYPDQEALHA